MVKEFLSSVRDTTIALDENQLTDYDGDFIKTCRNAPLLVAGMSGTLLITKPAVFQGAVNYPKKIAGLFAGPECPTPCWG